MSSSFRLFLTTVAAALLVFTLACTGPVGNAGGGRPPRATRPGRGRPPRATGEGRARWSAGASG